ncbi:MAG: Lrp/AsnC family transcriptional regulator [Rhodothermales bacterium]|nr:Lrp/AsnC family transcriptional regulator [Rhodothermales bacterium]MBO6778946.1 Lrp/AsnC family transcriptional regulator [Rhodothermales bacterium]
MLDSLDTTDRRILNILQEEGGISNVELSRRIGLAPPTTLERVRKLRHQGFITRTVTLVDPEKVGQSTLVFVHVSLTRHGAERVTAFQNAVQGIAEVLECHHISGDSDFLLKVRAPDISRYEAFLLDEFSSLPHVGRVHTSFVLSTVKSETRIPIPEATDG